jgi:hypothetical protein
MARRVSNSKQPLRGTGRRNVFRYYGADWALFACIWIDILVYMYRAAVRDCRPDCQC